MKSRSIEVFPEKIKEKRKREKEQQGFNKIVSLNRKEFLNT